MSKLVILGTAHGVNTPGKCSPDGKFREYKYSRETCARVAELLKARGVECVIDIPGEREQSLSARVQIVNNLVKKHGSAKNSIYISIHNNAAGHGDWMSARGFVCYAYTAASSDSYRLAALFTENARKRNLKGNRAWGSKKYYTANFYVLKHTTCPAVLTENLFQDNREDVAFLLSEEGRETIAKLHADSICDFLGVQY